MLEKAEKCRQDILDYLNSMDNEYIHNKNREDIAIVLDKIMDVFRKSDSDDNIVFRSDTGTCATKEDLEVVGKAVMDSLSFIKFIILNYPISNKFRDFVNNYVLFLNNWANMIADTRLATEIFLVHRLVEQHLTLIEAIGFLKHLINKVEQLKDYDVPSSLIRYFLGGVNK